MVLEGVARRLGRAARRDRRRAERIVAAPAGDRAASRRPTPTSTPRSSTPAVTRSGAATTPRTAAGAARRSSRRPAIEFLLRRGERQMALHTLRADGRRRHLRPGRRRLRPLLASTRAGSSPLREDALRQRAARARVPARLAGLGDEPFFERVRETLDWALRELRQPRAASPARSTPTPRASRASSTSGPPTRCARRSATPRHRDRALRHDRGRQLRGRQHPGARRRPTRSSSPRSRRACTSARARCARARRQAPDRLERAHDLGAGRRRRRARRAATTATPRSPPPSSSCATCATRRPPAAHLQPRPAQLNGYLEDHAFLLEALLTLYEATFEPRWFAEAARARRRDPERFADPEHGGFFSTAERPRGAHRAAARTSRTRRSRRRLGGRLRAAAAGRADRRGATRSRRSATCGCCTRSRPSTRPAFGHLLQAIDFHLATVREVALVGDDRAAARAVVRERVPPARGAGRRRRRTACPLLEGREPVDGRAAAYVCERFACQRPVTEPDELRALLE